MSVPGCCSTWEIAPPASTVRYISLESMLRRRRCPARRITMSTSLWCADRRRRQPPENRASKSNIKVSDWFCQNSKSKIEVNIMAFQYKCFATAYTFAEWCVELRDLWILMAAVKAMLQYSCYRLPFPAAIKAGALQNWHNFAVNHCTMKDGLSVCITSICAVIWPAIAQQAGRCSMRKRLWSWVERVPLFTFPGARLFRGIFFHHIDLASRRA